MQHHSRSRLWLTALMLLALAGCAIAPKEPPPATYVLDAVGAERSARPSGKVLLVGTPQAQPGFDTSGIAYSLKPLALDYYSQSQWADTPARMLEPLLVRSLERTGAFKAILAPPTPALGEYRLETDIIQLVQEFYQKPSQVRLTMRAKLFDLSSGHVLGTQLFEAVVRAESEDALGGVRAANRAVAEVMTQLTDFVIETAFAR